MRFYDAGDTGSYNVSPMTFLRGGSNRDQGRRVADMFNREYADERHWATDDRFQRNILEDMFERRMEEEDRLADAFESSEFYEEYERDRSWIREMTRVEDFRDIEPAMQLPILWYRPVREAVMRGEMEGFEGYDPALLPEEDPYERLLENGRGEVFADGSYELKWEFRTDDPKLSFNDIDIIREMRRVIREELIPSKIDPTNSRNNME